MDYLSNLISKNQGQLNKIHALEKGHVYLFKFLSINLIYFWIDYSTFVQLGQCLDKGIKIIINRKYNAEKKGLLGFP